MSPQLTPEEIKRELSIAFKNLRSPQKLSESLLLSLCVVEKHQQANPTLVPSIALKAFLTEVLDVLEAENSQHGAMLRQRFWDGKTAKNISDDKGLPERTLYKQQEKAQDEFFSLLWQREQACRQEFKEQPSVELNISESTQTTPDSATNHPRTSFKIVQVLVIGIVIMILITGAAFSIYSLDIQFQPSATPITQTISSRSTSSVGLNDTFTSVKAISVCDETGQTLVDLSVDRFIRSQGVSNFTVENTPGMLNNKVRALAIDQTGLWIGSSGTDENPASGLVHYNKKNIVNCGLSSILKNQNINALAVSKTGAIWVGTEKNGIAAFDGKQWNVYTTRDGLPSNQIYSLTIDENDNIWAGTWEGVAKFDGKIWSVPYHVENRTLSNNHVDAFAIDSQKNIWVGYIKDGVSEYRQIDNTWVNYDASTEQGLAGNMIRRIIVRPKSAQQPESIWFATTDGGISRFEQGKWTVYRVEDGLPSNAVNDLALDRYRRIWAATDKGVSYFDDKIWKRYTTLTTLSIAIGKSCPGTPACPFDDDAILTGTRTMGLTHSRLPLPVPVIKVLKICFETSQKDEKKCVPLDASFDPSLSEAIITATFPELLKPGEKLHFEITVSPEETYQLREGKGDFLSNTDDNDFNLFHAYPVIKVHGIEGILKTVEPGEPYTFTDYDNPFIAPDLPDGVKEQPFVSTWRVWMHTRYVGPYIRLVFTVKVK